MHPMKAILSALMFFAAVLTSAFAQTPPLRPDTEAKQKLQAMKQKLKKDEQAAMASLEEKLGPALALSIGELQIALQIKVKRALSGSEVFADDSERTYLGTIDDEFAANSIFNQFGIHGSQFSATSIWNTFGQFGGQFSSTSAFNSFTSSPPLLIRDKKVIGRLTVNKFIPGAVDPYWLKGFFIH